MLKKLHIKDDSTTLGNWQIFEVEDVCAKIKETYPVWPINARLYYKEIKPENDITPKDEVDIEFLKTIEGDIFLVNYPAGGVIQKLMDPFNLLGKVFSFLFPQPKQNIPSVAQRNTQNSSPNNELSARKNSPRPNGRIPDIYGTVRSTPDMLSVPYSTFINHEEVEYSFMCIGRGHYDISSVRDDTTDVSSIAGASVAIYPPFTSPNSGSPQLTIGSTITEPLYAAKKSSSVNGQVLRPPNAINTVGSSNIRFVYPNKIEVDSGANIDFTRVFVDGDSLTLSNATFTGSSITVNLNGQYTVLNVSATEITLIDPENINADWATLASYPTQATDYISPTLESVGVRWVGPFIVADATQQKILCNFVALNGLFKDNGTTQFAADVTLMTEVTPVDLNNVPTGAPETFSVVLQGSATFKSTRAISLKATPSFTGRCSIRARRISDTDLSFSGNVIDEVKWRDLYSLTPVTQLNFGNVTTVHSVTYATAGALSLKERKLNMLVTRKLPQRISGSTFTTELFATRNAADIISAIALDPFIGKRNPNELDFDNIYDTINDVISYFGTPLAAEFSYTFDNDNLSFEEMIKVIANVVGCEAYRRGNKIKLSFEKETEDSLLLFNHRNKLPGSETRAISFGLQNDNDGVELTYVDPTDDAVLTYYIPENRSAVNSKKIDSIGIRNKIQAYFLAKRAWNKLNHQRISTSFTATQEADLLLRNDRIIVADNTRTGTQDGQVDSRVGLELFLSQPVEFLPTQTYSIFLQHSNGTIEAVPITAGSVNYSVVLAHDTELPLALDDDNYAKTTYMIVGSAETQTRAFLVDEKDPDDNFTIKIKAINYDSRYYQNDKDYLNNVVDINGNIL